MVMPVSGLTMGMALRGRVAAGWWSLREDDDDWLWNVGGMNGGDDELREKTGATCTGCEGECSSLGDQLACEDSSEEALWIETICTDPLSVPAFPKLY